MNVLVVGSGGREHALCWALRKSPSVDHLFCAPGNGGIAGVATCVDIGGEDFSALIGFCKAENIGFVVVGPEAPLVDGLVDALNAAGIRAFGPDAAAAALEGSKGFMKDLCAKYDIPTAAYRRFADADAAKAYVAAQALPIVIKADGLAAGKGVVIAATLDDANATIDDILGGRFGQAGAEIVVEEFLAGEEASCFALVDGKSVLMLASAQDHKAVGDGDTGPNTGGMGAYSPAPVVTDTMMATIVNTIIQPTVDAMAAEGRPFRGVLFAGLMICDGRPKLLEYNIRFGDPECQVLMARLESDLLPLLLATCDGTLESQEPVWSPDAALVVVMAARGYPGAYEKGSEIGNLGAANDLPGVIVFHAGTRVDGGKVIADGGRVLGVTARGATVAMAQQRAYEAVSVIDWPEGFCRTDIGWRAIGR